MLEEIQTTPEDRRRTQVIVAMGVVLFGLHTLIDGLVVGGSTAMVLGAALAAAAATSLHRIRVRGRTRIATVPAPR